MAKYIFTGEKKEKTFFVAKDKKSGNDVATGTYEHISSMVSLQHDDLIMVQRTIEDMNMEEA